MQSIGVLENGGLKAAYAIRATGTRASSPLVHSGSGFAGRLSPFLALERACGTTGRFTAPAAPCANTWLPCALRTRQKQKPRTQLDACVPHADGLCGLLHCPRGVTCADADPFVRAVARTCTWTVRPCCRRLPPSASTVVSGPTRPGRGSVAATRIPLHISKTLATRPPIGTRRERS